MSKKIKMIVGTTRSGRLSESIASWVSSVAKTQGIDIGVLDLREHVLPFLDAPVSPMYAPVDTKEAKAWAAEIAEADGIVFVTAEYNKSIPAVLKNAIDYLYAEWNDKPVSIVSYGWLDGGGTATKHLKDIFDQVKANVVSPDISIQFAPEFFTESGTFADVEKSLEPYTDSLAEQLSKLNS